MISKTPSQFSIAFHQKPPLCLQEQVNAHFNPLLKFASELDVQFIFGFDGKKYPLKQATNNERSESRRQNMAKIALLYEKGDPNDLDEISNLMTKSTFVREDVIACVLDWAKINNIICIGAPYEADWQLCKLEMDGIIDGYSRLRSTCLGM